ncbi:Complement component 1 Q subcomponent-binding protein, mitochondrial [Wickerhamomyces ciferrii]|uniref:Complement component 1 Q subcomponent-binding protein, mitochondrial n=1 Tax=Wickerhamomyces ciferrii (strain ATCC 14091 / BCRC 22168 / CBS 111 / JCM 3599 / NBRC 0793 / NRRL Y-1031 F-60-10) TaxID=1206466 RepID=K0KED9_WICCF|nr:Complement component 1 Q subcomponent-binding protein, mitochondrial [Wickerhamomyces ciferrii]CCH40612.1 Complement component 1 Q subcomponent-binding protein, mitochondrial [Wickerhamomyces ciferrii]
MSFRLTARASSNILRTINRNAALRSSIPSIASRSATRSIAPRLFSTSSIRQNDAKESLRAALESEIQHENEADNSLPEELSEFFNKTGFQIAKTEGQSLGKLVKETEEETLNLYFDVNQAVNIRAIEENFEEDDLDKQPDEFFLNVNLVVVKKADNSAISFDLVYRTYDAAVVAEGVTHYQNASDALSEKAEDEQKREISYHGPAIANLDEQLVIALDNYLAALGIDDELLHQIINYGIFKENEEYLRWLNNLENFLKK